MLKTLSGVLCSGNISFDILARPAEEFHWHRTILVDSIESQLGGNGSNTSYALARLGVPVKLLGLVGADDFGERVLAILSGAGVDLSAVGRSRAPTTATICVVNRTGDRLFLQRLGSSSEAFPEPIHFTEPLLGGASHYHMANIFNLPLLRQHAAQTLERAHDAGLTTSVDTGWDAMGGWIEAVAPCLPHADIFFTNQDEARMLTGFADPDRAAEELQELGARDVVIKLGGQGCAVYTAEGVWRAPAFPVAVVDTTGAGDCFVGGFLAALHRGASYQEAARFANAVGALVVQKLGAITGVLSYEDTLGWMG